MTVLPLFTPDRIRDTFYSNHPLRPREVEELERLGIPPDALAGPTPVGAGYVIFESHGFEFDYHTDHGAAGTRAFIFLVTDNQGDASDIVAWSPQLGKLTPWLGSAWALGEEAIYALRLTDHGALPVHRSPVGWLRARKRGICLVRPEAAAHWLCDASPLLAEDDEHGVELKRLLMRPAPRILVSAPEFKKAF